MKKKPTKVLLSRRDFIRMAGLGTSAAVLASCGPKATPTPDAVEDVIDVVLRYQNHWSKETDAHYDGMLWLYDAFKAANPGITINNVLNPDGDESYKKILADCAAGDCPEILHGPRSEFWKAGYLLDLTEYIEADPTWKAQLLESTFFTSEGRIWGLTAEFSPMPTIWNTRILDAAGVSGIPSTWDAFLDACDKVKASGKTPTSWGVGGTHQFHNIIASQAGGMEALGANEFGAAQVREAFAQLKIFVDNKWIPDNEIEFTWQQSIANFVAEETAFYLNGAWTLTNEIRSEGAALDLQDNVIFAPYPAFGENGTTIELKKTTSIGIAADVVDTPGQLDAALTFLKFWFSPEGAKQWILLTKSPMGVKVDVSQIEGVDPLLTSFLSTADQADNTYGLPPNPAMQERGWGDPWSALQVLMLGGSVDEAVDTYMEELSSYV